MDIIALIKAERDKVARQLNGLNAPVRESPLLRKRVGQRLKARRFSQSRRASRISAAGLARIRAANRARWARVRAAKK